MRVQDVGKELSNNTGTANKAKAQEGVKELNSNSGTTVRVRVQDVIKDLTTSTGTTLDSVTKVKKRAMLALDGLKKKKDDLERRRNEEAERKNREDQKRRYEDEAQMMSAYDQMVRKQKAAESHPETEETNAGAGEEKAVNNTTKSSTEPKPTDPNTVETKPAKTTEKASETQPAKNADKAAEPKAAKNTDKAAEPKPARNADAKAVKPADAKPVKNAEAKPAPKNADAKAAGKPQAAGTEAKPQNTDAKPQAGAENAAKPQNASGQKRDAHAQTDSRRGAQTRTQQAPAANAQAGAQTAAGQPRFGRPAQTGTQGAAGAQGAAPAAGQPRFGRAQQGAAAGNPAGGTGRPAGAQGTFGRPAGAQNPAGGQARGFNNGRPTGGAQGAPGKDQRPVGRGPMGGMGKDAPQGNQGRGYSGGSKSAASRSSRASVDIIPPVTKERVSNYDPKKNQYVRQVDPEHNKNAGRKRDTSNNSGYDDDFVRGKKKKKQAAAPVAMPEPVVIDKAVMTAETITVRELSERIGKPAGEIIKKLFLQDIVATINNELDFDTAGLVCAEFDIELEKKIAETAEDALDKEDIEDTEEELEPRPPVVTIMGHVDHGKTSLLDYIRKSHVTQGEAGGITQHIGAYTVNQDGRQITFLDTPGHEAFTSMRLRGAMATDIAVLVVAADDGVMPQTVEAIHHAKAAGVQTIVAINKIDKPAANVERIRQQLTEYDLVCEEWGGDTIMVPVSAVTGEGVDTLLEMILLVADMQNYRANPNRKARGIIIEARLDKGRGPVATVLVKNGTLNVGDTIVAGMAYGRVRAMNNERGERLKTAGPSDPVEVIGFNDVPEAGDQIMAVDDDKLSRMVAEERRDKAKAAMVQTQQKTTLDDLFSQISAGQVKELNVIIKADVQGSVEAVRQSLEKLTNEEVRVRSIHGGVGAITETDVMLAAASNAIIIGFNVRPDSNAREMAEKEKIDIRLYRVIYQAIEDVQKAMKGLLAPKYKEVLLGHVEVRQLFRISGVGTVAGGKVMDGKISRSAQLRLLRDNVVIHEGKVSSLKRLKDDVKEVNAGYECGIGIEGYNDIKENDVIECFLMEEVEQ